MRGTVSAPGCRSRFAMAAAALLFAALVSTSPVAANPLPIAAVFTHVEAHQAGFCGTTTVTSCEQIVQISSETGFVDFDLFFVPVASLLGAVESFRFEFDWPHRWTIQSLEVCCGTHVLEPGDDGLVLTIDVDPGYQADQFFPIARLALDVPVAGRLVLSDLEMDLGGGPFWILGVPGRAGVPCGTCVQLCDFGDACIADADVDLVEMTAPEGGGVTTQFRGWTSGLNPLCEVYFSSPADWLDVAAMPSPSGGYDVFVTADASGLALGTHETVIQALTPTCTACVQIVLTVSTATPVQRETWGNIKRQFH